MNQYLNRIFTFSTFFAAVLFANSTKLSDLETRLSNGQLTDFNTMQQLIISAGEKSFIEIREIGKSVQGRELYLLRLGHGAVDNPWKIMFVAQQHGNEPAGKEALLFLLQQIIAKPDLLPPEVELYLIPSINPDGAELAQRRNANGADLNRDHLLLSQPETRILHAIARDIRPHVVVDCHEFTRDSQDYLDKGWREWPLIMMDCANNPLITHELYDAGVEWCERFKAVMEAQGYNYQRYIVGNPPPEGEIRHSTMEVDDARNGIGINGSLSFIIESGIRRKANNPQADIMTRVQAYFTIFKNLMHDNTTRKSDLDAIDRYRQSAPPEFIPVNYFWGSTGSIPTKVPVIDTTSGNTELISVANFHNERIFKRFVNSPFGYIIPSSSAAGIKNLLLRHAVVYRELENDTTPVVEACKLERIEEDWDPVYSRYGMRQIVSMEKPGPLELPAGSFLIPLTLNNAVRVITLLEPNMLYGLYQYQEYRDLIDADGVIPVYRIVQ